MCALSALSFCVYGVEQLNIQKLAVGETITTQKYTFRFDKPHLTIYHHSLILNSLESGIEKEVHFVDKLEQIVLTEDGEYMKVITTPHRNLFGELCKVVYKITLLTGKCKQEKVIYC